MKTLIVLSHPSIDKSVINKRWINEVKKYPDLVTVHHLEALYSQKKFNIEAEQALVEKHDNLILQFPVYWFNCPPMMKKWLDEVFTHGWAYGSRATGLRGRKAALAVTAGIDKEGYAATGKYRHTLAEILRPFEMTFTYCRADYCSFFAFYGAENADSEGHAAFTARVEQNAKEYLTFIQKMSNCDSQF